MEEIKITGDKKNTSRKAEIIVMLSIIFVAISIMLIIIIPTSTSVVNYENYMKIHNGMTYSEVVDIFDGMRGELVTSSSYGGYTLEYYNWSNSSYDVITVGFENGLVCTKAQIGL